MKKDDFKTDVIFRTETDEIGYDVYALFPYEIATLTGLVMSYQEIGQHLPTDYSWCIQKSVPAKPEEYKDLKSELESIGYNLRIIKKRNYHRYLEAWGIAKTRQ